MVIAIVEKNADETYTLKPLKQKLFVDGLCYLLQEIYGIENKNVTISKASSNLIFIPFNVCLVLSLLFSWFCVIACLLLHQAYIYTGQFLYGSCQAHFNLLCVLLC